MALEIVPSEEPLEGVAADTLVVGALGEDGGATLAAGADSIDEALDGKLSEYLDESGFKAKAGEVVIIPTLGKLPARAIAVVGLGPRSEVTPARLRSVAGTTSKRLSQNSIVASTLHQALPVDDAAAAATEGFLLGAYRFTSYKSAPAPSKLQKVLFLGGGQQDGISGGTARARATMLARDLTNQPASDLSPEALALRAYEIAEASGLECTVFDEEELARRGFGGLLGVAQGSLRPPRLIQLRYVPKNPLGRLALVGKGVTFDSGGLSMKDAKNMESMKTDMAGGAAVLGAMSALESIGARHEVIGIVPATENMPGGRAMRPGDVIKHYGGKTCEVLNTDAEGRLILADALAFASEQQPEAILDAATLTGSMMIALGQKATGYFSNDDALAAEVEEAANAAGERVWRMPLYDDYRAELDSDVADMKNIGSRWSGAILAALFLRDFVGKDIPWAHLDIAGPARAEGDYDEFLKGGTGVPTRTLIRWVEGRRR